MGGPHTCGFKLLRVEAGERRWPGDRRGRQSHAVWRDGGTPGTPGEPMAAGRRIWGPFLLGSPSGKEDSDACGDSASWGAGARHSPAARLAQGGSRGSRRETPLRALATRSAPPTAPAARWVWSSPPPREEFPHTRARLDPRPPD